MDAIKEHFLNSKQISVKVSIALSCLFDRNGSATDHSCYIHFLQKHPFPAVKQLTEKKDSKTLSRLLSSSWFDSSIAGKILQDTEVSDPACRILLANPHLASQSLAKKDAPSLPQSLVRWSLRLGREYPTLRPALSQWKAIPDPEMKQPGTDGKTIHYPASVPSGTDTKTIPDAETEQSGADTKTIHHAETEQSGAEERMVPDQKKHVLSSFDYSDYLHMLIHCLFFHWKVPSHAEPDIWNLACDLQAEQLKAEIFPEEGNPPSLACFRNFPPGLLNQSVTAVYQHLKESCSPEELSQAFTLFRCDDHRLWYLSRQRAGKDKALAENISRNSTDSSWEGLAAGLKGSHSQKRHFGLAPGSHEEKIILREQGKYDFSQYLRRFSVTKEEIKMDPENFDYIPYYYGWQRDHRMPFIEPLEYTEMRRVEEFVIAIDTSGSCSLPIVHRFLAEIQSTLMEGDHFFQKMNLHLIQCDSEVQQDQTIRSREEWIEYCKDIRIQGRGGTDFTPVFRHVEKLQQQGELSQLKGLLYFTDGDGIYPRFPTKYETAFVFTDQRFLHLPVPPWITCLCLDLDLPVSTASKENDS
ncbi:MAG: VWA-like domain-containing protein [Clostridiales bacterium]|nr:VWA-like domain-containing protein [Clostridiales bacterium]